MNAKARRLADGRILCGHDRCGATVATDDGRPGVVVLPVGVYKADDGTYRWSSRADPQRRDGRKAEAHRAGKPPVYSTAEWDRVGPVTFARPPVTIPCPNGHKNDVDAKV